MGDWRDSGVCGSSEALEPISFSSHGIGRGGRGLPEAEFLTRPAGWHYFSRQPEGSADPASALEGRNPSSKRARQVRNGRRKRVDQAFRIARPATVLQLEEAQR